MSLSTILRRSASTVVPLAARVIGGQRCNHQFAALFSAVQHRDLTSQIFPKNFPSNHHYSISPALKKLSSDESLLRILDAEIDCAEEADSVDVQEVPAGFPFEIKENPEQQTVSLSRKYQGETIRVEVAMSSLTTGDEDEDEAEGDDNDEDSEKASQSSLPMVVRVSKKGGASLEFCVTAYPDEISIDSLSVKDPKAPDDDLAYEGPQFDELDENLQKGFHKYLEIRGIKPSTTNFLHEYTLNKDSREYKNFLKKVKNFHKYLEI